MCKLYDIEYLVSVGMKKFRVLVKYEGENSATKWFPKTKVCPSYGIAWYCMSELKLNYPGSTSLTRLRLQKWEPYLHCIRRPFFITWFNNNIMHKILNTAGLTAVFIQKSQYLVAILNKWSVRNEERDLIKISAISWISSRRTWYSSVTLWHIPVLFPIVAHPNSLIDLPVTIWCIARWLVITGSDFTRRLGTRCNWPEFHVSGVRWYACMGPGHPYDESWEYFSPEIYRSGPCGF